MIFCDSTDHEGAADERKDAPAGKEFPASDAGVSHSAGFQTSPKMRVAQATAALGYSSFDLGDVTDDMERRRQFARKIRSRQSTLPVARSVADQENPFQGLRKRLANYPCRCCVLWEQH